MTRPFRFLGVINSMASRTYQSPAYDSNFVIILAALLCALICVLGLIAVACCAWLCHISAADSTTSVPLSNKGLKKKVLRYLPTLAVTASESSKCSDCAICLARFSLGDEIRVLPDCRHRFHVPCIDTWFGSHSSCPSCRHILWVARCDKDGGLTANKSSSHGPDNEARVKGREN